jgi:Sporulation and spore germination/L,D-transpeptidase catalytic domain/Putative peptidoglycan binding domain
MRRSAGGAIIAGMQTVGQRRRGTTAALVAGLFVLAGVGLGAGSAIPAAPAKPRVAVFLLQGEQLARVTRPGATSSDAVRQLIAGPTSLERKRAFRTYVPSDTPVRSVSVTGGIATVDLGHRFVEGRDPTSLLARLSQLVRTLTGLEGATQVQLLIDGATVTGVFPGIPTESPITFRFLQTPNVAVPAPRKAKLPAPDKHTRDVQRRLIELGYLRAGDADGRLGPLTQTGILAFQKWERLARTGSLDRRTEARLATASRPAVISRARAGKRAEILLDRQVALLIVDNQAIMVVAVSSGKPSTPTPPGDYRVYAKIPRWWSTPFREWLPWAIPFVGGIAFHEFADVPVYPASHGCVRQTSSVARRTYDFAEIGMPVKVIARS